MNEKRSPDDPARERTIAEQEEQEPENPGSAVGPMQTVVERVTQVGAPPTHHPLFDKFEPEHVTQFLTNAHDVDRNRVRFLSSNRWFHLVYTLIGVSVFVFLTLLLLPEQARTYFEILKSLGIFAAGAAGGYGLGTYQERRQG